MIKKGNFSFIQEDGRSSGHVSIQYVPALNYCQVVIHCNEFVSSQWFYIHDRFFHLQSDVYFDKIKFINSSEHDLFLPRNLTQTCGPVILIDKIHLETLFSILSYHSFL